MHDTNKRNNNQIPADTNVQDRRKVVYEDRRNRQTMNSIKL
jgi:hypothetical protein